MLLSAHALALGRPRSLLHRSHLSSPPRPLSLVPNTTRYFDEQALDHYDPQDTRMWRQRYFVNESFFEPSAGPVFLCVGGEGPPLEPTVVVTGDLHCADLILIAQQQHALILALEHRFYGESIPTKDFSTASLRYLSSRQALADIATFHAYIVAKYNLQGNKWVTFGGSYPGMLSAWARLKFPHLIHAAVSSSSPVQAIENFQGYNDVVGASLGNAMVGGSAECLQTVNSTFEELGAQLQSASGRRQLEALFHVCGQNALDVFENQQQLLQNLFDVFPVQSNDPTCTQPGCNIQQVCRLMLDPEVGTPLQRLGRLVALAQGPTCLDCYLADYIALLLNGTGERVWTYQTCAEFAFYQTCDPGSACPFTRAPWLDTLQSSLALCSVAYNITAAQVAKNVADSNNYYGGDHPGGTRILFVNGDIDPWHVQSVLKSLSPLLPALVVPGASHHAWTHPPRPTDSPAVVRVRVQIAQYVHDWLELDP